MRVSSALLLLQKEGQGWVVWYRLNDLRFTWTFVYIGLLWSKNKIFFGRPQIVWFCWLCMVDFSRAAYLILMKKMQTYQPVEERPDLQAANHKSKVSVWPIRPADSAAHSSLDTNCWLRPGPIRSACPHCSPLAFLLRGFGPTTYRPSSALKTLLLPLVRAPSSSVSLPVTTVH